MAISIAPEQRDALYDQLVDRLSAIDDVRVAVEREDFETADRLAREVTDDLRFVCDDLGWGAGRGGEIELRCPPDLLQRVFTRLGEAAEQMAGVGAEQEKEIRELRHRNRTVVRVARRVLVELEDEAP